MTPDTNPASAAKWTSLPYHRNWLVEQAGRLFDFFEPNSINPAGGFFDLDDAGRPLGASLPRQIHNTTRMVHCFAVARLMGRPGAEAFIDHGMDFIWNGHRDPVNGGYMWGIGEDGPADDRKQAYGHAFVLLAAASAKVVGHPGADRLLADVAEILHTRFWEPAHGAVIDTFSRDWQPSGPYRGQNANMHLSEAAMAAYEATGDGAWLEMADSIAKLIIFKHAAANQWRVPEHYDEAWRVDHDFGGDEVFRPSGVTPGHGLEWARLILELWELGGRRGGGHLDAARGLLERATADGWDGDSGGFFYTVDWSGKPRRRNRLWWPAAEGIGAAAFLNAIDGDPKYEAWYRRIWDFVANRLIDPERGGWRSEAIDPASGAAPMFEGKPDLYHALQACLIPLLPTAGSITRGLMTAGL